MFAPLVAVLFSKVGLEGNMSWKIRIKGGNIPYILRGMVCPSAVGNCRWHTILPWFFPRHSIRTFLFLPVPNWRRVYGSAGSDQYVTLQHAIIVSSLCLIDLAPWFNILFAVGEEAGWRGAMYPILKERIGKAKRAYHWRHHLGSVALADYHSCLIWIREHHTGDIGNRTVAVLCHYVSAMAILLDYYYKKANSIWFGTLAAWCNQCLCGSTSTLPESGHSDQLPIGPLMIRIMKSLPLNSINQ